MDEIVYAIGDIHGEIDLLLGMYAAIQHDAKNNGYKNPTIMHLGDYIDRGANSKAVVDELLKPIPGFQKKFVMGNHERMLLDFFEDPTRWHGFILNGGVQTLASYGVEVQAGDPIQDVWFKMISSVPRDHLEFFKSLPYYHEIGKHLYVHAGINPTKKLEDQSLSELIWIRDAFLDCTDTYSHIVVHGHSFTKEPKVLHNRIGIDTGSCFRGVLTCAVIEPDKPVRIIQKSDRRNLS